jgi:hypothetical protein
MSEWDSGYPPYLCAWSGPDIEISVYTVFVPGKPRQKKTPPGCDRPKNFQMKNLLGFTPRWWP